MERPRKRRSRGEQRAARQLAKDERLTYQQALQRLRKNRDSRLMGDPRPVEQPLAPEERVRGK